MSSKKYYPALLVIVYSLLGMTIPAAVSQFSMSVAEIAKAMHTSEQLVLAADTVRAACLVAAMFLSNLFYRKLGLRKTIALGLCFQILPQFLLPTVIEMGSLPLLYLLKGLQGCNSIAFPLYISAILMWVDDCKAGFSTALFNGSFIAGSGVGGWLAAKLIPGLGWQSSFYIIGLFCAAFAIPAILVTVQKPSNDNGDMKKKETSSYKKIAKMPVTWVAVLATLASSWVSQAVVVDLPLYTANLKYSYEQSGSLMFLLSVITVTASVLAGFISDRLSQKSANKFRARCLVLGFGYVLSAVASVILPAVAQSGFWVYSVISCCLIAGASWSSGALWPIMNYIYNPQDRVSGTSFCSSASTISNPVAPFITGVVLGTAGLWTQAWWIAAVVSLISFIASVILFKGFQDRRGGG